MSDTKPETGAATPSDAAGSVPPIERFDGVIVHKLLLAFCDAYAVIAAFYLSYSIRNHFFYWRGGDYSATRIHDIFLAGLIGIIIMLFRQNHLYQQIGFGKSTEHLEVLSWTWVKFVTAFIVISFLFKVQLFIEHRITTAIFFVLGWMGLYLGRFVVVPWIVQRMLTDDRFACNTLIVGANPTILRKVREFLAKQPWKNRILGYVDVCAAGPDEMGGVPYLGSYQVMQDFLKKKQVDEVYIQMKEQDWPRLAELLEMIRPYKVRVRVAIEHFDIVREKVPYLPELESGFFFFNFSPFLSFDQTLKRMVDLAVSGVGLLLLLPVFLVVGLLIRVESAGPVFFRQKRVGKGGKPFRVFKFRSMYQNTEAHHQKAVDAIMKQDDRFFEQSSGQSGFFKATDSEQVTKMGRWLRKTSLDELPQLINVLKGEMSLVGPRPEPQYQVDLYKPWHHLRHAVQPGISGFWQVFGRSVVSHDEMVLMDIFYINNWSFSLDLRIIIRTLFAVLTGRGAV